MSQNNNSPTVLPDVDVAEDTRLRRIPPYNVILHNDDDHSMDFVFATLRKVLGCAEEKAFQLMMEAHETGRSIIWTGPREGAELKQEQMLTHHEIRERDNRKLGPLTVTIEPAPGA